MTRRLCSAIFVVTCVVFAHPAWAQQLSAAQLQTLKASINASTTSDRAYPGGPESIAARFGGSLPTRHVIFVTHNSGANSNSTGGNHFWSYLPIQYQGV